MEAVAVHPDMAILVIVLLILAVAILIIGWDLLMRPRRSIKSSPVADNNDNFEDVLQAVEAEEAPAPTHELKIEQTDSAFRRNHDQPPLTVSSQSPSQVQPSSPTKIEFSTIQNEIRAALGQAAQSATQAPAPRSATLSWTESGRLAVLSLGDTPPENAWPLLQAQGIYILIVPETHPFPPPNRTIDLLCLPDIDEATMSALIAKLRAKLAKGERIAFYTETGLTGPAALLAARLSGRMA